MSTCCKYLNLINCNRISFHDLFLLVETGDHVKCFCCDGALRNWEPNDDPWVEHARWFSRCNFLVSVKGNEYIKTILAGHQVRRIEKYKFFKRRKLNSKSNLQQTSTETSEDSVQEEKKVTDQVEKTAPAVAQVTPASTEDEAPSNKLRDSLLCQICYDQQLSMVFIPCGHSLCCPSCSTALTVCPLCRKPIEATVRAFFPFS